LLVFGNLGSSKESMFRSHTDKESLTCNFNFFLALVQIDSRELCPGANFLALDGWVPAAENQKTNLTLWTPDDCMRRCQIFDCCE